jgi:hypothetical protein
MEHKLSRNKCSVRQGSSVRGNLEYYHELLSNNE